MFDAEPAARPNAAAAASHDGFPNRWRRRRPRCLRQSDRRAIYSGPIDNPEGWLFRIAHNAALDFLRSCARIKTTQLDDEVEIGAACQAETADDSDVVAASFRTFLQLPVLQRRAVILKDVLGQSVEEISATADCSCSVPAAE
jgi:DNA-directed RNA polymerase specialized sigma24 family protein